MRGCLLCRLAVLRFWVEIGGGALCEGVSFAGLLCFVLSLGPVLLYQGEPIVLGHDRVFPLPFFLIEQLWGVSSLSLLYRLGLGTMLVIALLVGLAPLNRNWFVFFLLILLFELRIISPAASYPHFTDALPETAFRLLKAAPPGAVMNHPVVGGQRYLYEQTIHHKPLAATLNFPNNVSARRLWKKMIAASKLPHGDCKVISKTAKQIGIRYLVLHHDMNSRPDIHDKGARFAQASCKSHYTDKQISIVELW